MVASFLSGTYSTIRRTHRRGSQSGRSRARFVFLLSFNFHHGHANNLSNLFVNKRDRKC